MLPQKLKNKIAIWSSISSPRYITKGIKNRYSNKHLHENDHSITVYNSQKVETTHRSINRGMDKQNVSYPYSGILRGHKKERSTDTCYNMDESWDFPGGPVAKTLTSQCRGPRFDPWSGN